MQQRRASWQGQRASWQGWRASWQGWREARREYEQSPKKRAELGHLGGNINNAFIEKRSLAATEARETCVLCKRVLGRCFFWPEQWRHRTEDNIKMKCKECSPTRPKGQPSGYMQLNEQRSREAAAKPLTCQVCERTMPRTQFRAGKNGKFDLRKPQTCEQCRAEGKLPMAGRKKRRLE